jgi:WD40 repeat protein
MQVMKKVVSFGISVSLLFFLVVSYTFAQDYRQLSLPAGATMRIGKGRINDIQYSPDGTRLAVASSIGIWLYDTATYQEVALVTGYVDSVAFSPDGSTLASGSEDGTVLLWEFTPSATTEPRH